MLSMSLLGAGGGDPEKYNLVFVFRELTINMGGYSHFCENFINPLMHTQRCQRQEPP